MSSPPAAAADTTTNIDGNLANHSSLEANQAHPQDSSATPLSQSLLGANTQTMRQLFPRDPSRLVLFSLNAVMLIMGLVFFGVTVFNLAANQYRFLLLDTNMLLWILIIVSLVVMILSAFGCFTALGDSRRTLYIYGILVFGLFLVQLFLLLFAFSSTSSPTLPDTLSSRWQTIFDTTPTTLQDLELHFHCCGFNTILDRSIPFNCSTSTAFGFQSPCQPLIIQQIWNHQTLISIVMMIILFLQSLILILLFLVWKKLPSDLELSENYRDQHSDRLWFSWIHDPQLSGRTRGNRRVTVENGITGSDTEPLLAATRQDGAGFGSAVDGNMMADGGVSDGGGGSAQESYGTTS